MIAARAVALAALVALVACSSGKDAPPAPATQNAQGALAPGTVAQVGRHAITVPLIARVVRMEHVTPAEARDRAVRDALLACGAEEAGLDRGPEARLGTQGVLARRLLREIADEVEKSPITDAELKLVTEQRWLEYDRPEGVRVVHAVVLVDAKADAAKQQQAQAVAEALRAALVAVHDRAGSLPLPAPPDKPEPGRPPPEDPLSQAFLRAAGEVPHVGFELKPEELPPVAADGRMLIPKSGSLVPEFAQAAVQLEERGELSGIVRTPFGLHVMMLLEKLPALRVPEAERRDRLHGEIMAIRARAAVDQILTSARPRVTRAADADALLAKISIEP
ncbi:MAG: peptidyl-prolyl cis-trans isomerase [Byssovorax sp.]